MQQDLTAAKLEGQTFDAELAASYWFYVQQYSLISISFC